MANAVLRNSSKTGNGLDPDGGQKWTVRREQSNESAHNEWDPSMESSSEDYKPTRGSLKGSSWEVSNESMPTVLPMRLTMVEGLDRLPANDSTQEVLCRKLCLLEADLSGVVTLISELSAHFVSINSEERTIFITFKSIEDIWKFSTYQRMGFLSQCMENVLMDQQFWLTSLDHHSGIEISIEEETLLQVYKGFLMQEGSFFGCCKVNQVLDSCTSAGDLYLEKGDIALFEPPFLGSCWSALCLADGSRGTKQRPNLEPVPLFHEWFLKSCPESILVGGGKDTHCIPFQIAVGVCETIEDYDAEGPDELNFLAGDLINIHGLLLPCFQWFMGKSQRTGETGLVKTNLVKANGSFCESSDLFLKNEDKQLLSMNYEQIKENTLYLLKELCQSGVSKHYKLDKIPQREADNLQRKVGHILGKSEDSRRKEHSLLSSSHQKRKDANENEAMEAPLFNVNSEEDMSSSDGLHAFILFLSSSEYKPEFLLLYSAYPEFLITYFQDHSSEEDMVVYFCASRELARKKHAWWAQSRICFLLGQLSAGRSKFSQARVYYEEALNVPRDSFTDTFLLSAIYSNLALIYLTQKNQEKFFSVSERFSALLMAVPDCLFGCEDPEVLKYVLKKTILASNVPAEARACFLLAKLHLKLKDGTSAVPFIERLLILASEGLQRCDEILSHGFLVLARLYSEMNLPRLAESCAWQATLQVGASVSHCLYAVSLLLENSLTIHAVSVPTQVAPYLIRAAGLGTSSEEPELPHIHALCLSCLFHKHNMPDRAVRSMSAILNHSSFSNISKSDSSGALLWLAWLHICNQQPGISLEVLDVVLSSLPEHCTTQLEGLVYNMRAIAHKHSGDICQAAESYQAAMDICEEFEDRHNLAVALANFGFMCLEVRAGRLAVEHLTGSVELFSELEDEGHELSFISVLLEMGRLFVSEGNIESGKIYFEWALLMAMYIHHIDSQLLACKVLCELYDETCPDEGQCIIYSKHQLKLLQQTGDKSSEAEILEKISRLYLKLDTHKATRAALDYTKRSLAFYIDLGRKQKEAHAWLQAGKIYHNLQQTELVELYLQVAQNMALNTEDKLFTLEIMEAAGDVFFNSTQDREKAIVFYRDQALPVAVKMSSVRAQLRLCNKLSELLLNLGRFAEAIEFTNTSLDISISLGDSLNERVAFHRLATLYHCQGHFELAEHHFLKALSLCPSPLEYDEESLYFVRVYQTLGDIIFYDVKDPYDAAGYYHLALAAAMDLGNKRSQLQLCTRLATIYHNFLMDRELSLFFYQRARGFANDLNIRRINLAPDYSFSTTSQYKNTRTVSGR